MRDLGSYVELELEKGRDLFNSIPSENIVYLNTCRAGIYHAVRCYGVNKVWIAKYQCDVVRDFLERKGLQVLYYDIDERFNPLIERNEKDSAIVLTNYFGVLGDKHFEPLLSKYHNVIIDNAQALFYNPLEGCINCYSPRKFVAAPDGAYVIGKGVNQFSYKTDRSSDTSQFLLMRYEYGCNGEGYRNKKINDERIDSSDIMYMSPLTKALLDTVDYDKVKQKRTENFNYARSIFDGINKLDVNDVFEKDCCPMGYPLWTDFEIIPEFHRQHIYQARYWEYLIDEKESNCLEYNFAKYVALICIDQRYSKEEIDYQYRIVNYLKEKVTVERDK